MQLFSPNNIWNIPVDSLPVHPSSADYLSFIGLAAPFRLDDTMPINLVRSSQPLVPVSLNSGNDDLGGYPIPPNPAMEPPGSDAHCLMIDIDLNMLYEIFSLSGAPGSWAGGSGAKWDLSSHALRIDGWTSADAAGLPIAVGVARYTEILAGTITHALRFTAPRAASDGSGNFSRGHIWPGRHDTGGNLGGNPAVAPFGTRIRLKASVDISGFSPVNQIVLKALKRYGAILADNGIAFGCQHDQDTKWNATDLVNLHGITGSAFEVVDTSGLMTNPDMGLALPAPLPRAYMESDRMGRPTPANLSLSAL